MKYKKLKEIKKMCKSKHGCYGCIFKHGYYAFLCKARNLNRKQPGAIPLNWKLKKKKIKEKGFVYQERE